MDDLEAEMLSDRYTSEVRAKISDSHTLNVSAYDPDGLESSQEFVAIKNFLGGFC